MCLEMSLSDNERCTYSQCFSTSPTVSGTGASPAAIRRSRDVHLFRLLGSHLGFVGCCWPEIMEREANPKRTYNKTLDISIFLPSRTRPTQTSNATSPFSSYPFILAWYPLQGLNKTVSLIAHLLRNTVYVHGLCCWKKKILLKTNTSERRNNHMKEGQLVFNTCFCLRENLVSSSTGKNGTWMKLKTCLFPFSLPLHLLYMIFNKSIRYSNIEGFCWVPSKGTGRQKKQSILRKSQGQQMSDRLEWSSLPFLLFKSFFQS